jgi:DNA-binding NarL/FixJ family response regulator
MRILLIEDDDQMRRALVDRLASENVETVYNASDFDSALDSIHDVDGVLCDDAFPFVEGEPPFEWAWLGMRDAAQALGKPFVLIAGNPDAWLEASHQDVQAYRKRNTAEAVAHLVRTVGKDMPAAPAAVLANADSAPIATHCSR